MEINLSEKITAFIKKEIPRLNILYLFGSILKGNFTSSNDIDLAFLAEQKIDNLKRWSIQEKLASILLKNVDLIDLQSASEVMRFQIISQGKRIYEKDHKKTETFEDYTYYMYLDLNEQRQAILDDIKNYGTVYG